MEDINWVKIVTNKIILSFLVIILIVLNYNLDTYKSGFYCNDQTINMKYFSSTVANELLVFVSLLTTLVFVYISEVMIKTRDHNNRIMAYKPRKGTSYQLKLHNKSTFVIDEYYGNIYISYGFFLIGNLLTQIVTLIGKKTIGRLRPNFLDVCKPAINPYEICGELHKTGKTYLIPEIDFTCTANDKENIAESRLSFPSGHSSTAFYTAVFLIIYLNQAWKSRSCSVILHIVQVFVFASAAYVAMTRITDNKHHVTDVLAGASLGTIIAFKTGYHLNEYYKKKETCFKQNSKLLVEEI